MLKHPCLLPTQVTSNDVKDENSPWAEHIGVPSLTAHCLSRQAAYAKTPVLEWMLEAVLERLIEELDNPPPAQVLSTNSDLLQPLLGDPNVAPEALVMLLPPQFEPVLDELVVQPPDVFNYPTVDLLYNNTYLGYGITLPGEAGATGLWLFGDWLPGVLCCAAPDDIGSGDVNDGDRLGKRVPVVMMAGNTVAIGGFLVTEYFLSGAQAASICAASHRPYNVYSDKELEEGAALAREVGCAPWFAGFWLASENFSMTVCQHHDFRR